MNIAIFKDTILYNERSKRILAAKKRKEKSFFYLICKSQSLPDSSRRRIRNLGSEMKTVLSTVSMCESLLRTHDTLKCKKYEYCNITFKLSYDRNDRYSDEK